MKIPVVYGIVLGGEERYGELDAEGNFYETQTRAPGYVPEVDRLTDTLGLMRCFAEMLDASGETVARVEIGVVDGRIACIAIKALPGKELTGQLLRQAPLSKLVREAAKAHIVHLRNGFAVRFIQGNPVFSPPGETEQPKRRARDREFLTNVALTYREAVAAGENPAAAVEKAFSPTTPENARRWIMRAREEGVLGPSLGQGKAGEI